MKHLKTYNQLNEGLRDKMSPKSEDDILDYLSKLNPIKRYNTIKKNNIDSKFLPSDEEILAYFKSATNSEKSEWLLKLVSQDNIKFVKKILDLGVDLNLNYYYYYDNSKDGFTLLHIAIHNESIDMVELLIKYGANPYIKDANEVSSVELAKIYNIDIISMILKKPNVNEGLRDKMTPKSSEDFVAELANLTVVELKQKLLDIWKNYIRTNDLEHVFGNYEFAEMITNETGINIFKGHDEEDYDELDKKVYLYNADLTKGELISIIKDFINNITHF